jgi:hypothetical protein
MSWETCARIRQAAAMIIPRSLAMFVRLFVKV